MYTEKGNGILCVFLSPVYTGYFNPGYATAQQKNVDLKDVILRI